MMPTIGFTLVFAKTVQRRSEQGSRVLLGDLGVGR